jgi:hypothetical protein
VLRASVSTFEEKGSDVNVATQLLLDVLTDRVDAATMGPRHPPARLKVTSMAPFFAADHTCPVRHGAQAPPGRI